MAISPLQNYRLACGALDYSALKAVKWASDISSERLMLRAFTLSNVRDVAAASGHVEGQPFAKPAEGRRRP